MKLMVALGDVIAHHVRPRTPLLPVLLQCGRRRRGEGGILLSVLPVFTSLCLHLDGGGQTFSSLLPLSAANLTSSPCFLLLLPISDPHIVFHVQQHTRAAYQSVFLDLLPWQHTLFHSWKRLLSYHLLMNKFPPKNLLVYCHSVDPKYFFIIILKQKSVVFFFIFFLSMLIRFNSVFCVQLNKT